jgi:alpha-tubulin suppressor-like RCC1 family protein
LSCLIATAAVALMLSAPVPAGASGALIGITAGFGHVCSIRPGGTVACWGENIEGQVGLRGDHDFVFRPTNVKQLGPALQVSGGKEHTCAVLRSRTVKCWGNNDRGQLGSGSRRLSTATPSSVDSLGRVKQVSSGLLHTCALTITGHVKCWGGNWNRQLGDGTSRTRNRPVAVKSVSGVTQISAGGNHTCALLEAGRVKCWGGHSRPSLVRSISGAIAISVGVDAAGMSATSLQACAVLKDHRISCWGPTMSAKRLAGVSGVRGISMSHDLSCANLLNGKVECWDENGRFVLLDGSTAVQRTPVALASVSTAVGVTTGWQFACAELANARVSCWGAIALLAPGLTAVPNLANPLELASADGFTCARLAEATASCWGRNKVGQLGNGTRFNRAVPAPVKGLHDVAQLSAAQDHVCALAFAGAVSCWGGAFDDSDLTVAPFSIMPSQINGLDPAIQVSTGFGHACALLADHTAKCWGNNSDGQLGDGTRDVVNPAVPAPVAVTGLTGVQQVSAGVDHSCALLLDGTVRCWGDNSAGELGDGTTTAHHSPTAVGGLTNVMQVRAGGHFTCALISDGSVDCWGLNDGGQLGDGTTANRSVPAPVQSISGAVDLKSDTAAGISGASVNCVTHLGGEVDCWGAVNPGLAHDPQAIGQKRPSGIDLGFGVSRLGVGSSSSCAITGFGDVRCWGSNSFGQLGNGFDDLRATIALEVPGLRVRRGGR